MLKLVNMFVLAAFFVLELIAIVVFSYWGYRADAGQPIDILLAIAIPLAVVVLWGMFLAPKASVPALSLPTRTALKFVVFALASAALYESGHHALGGGMLAISAVIVGTVFIFNLHKA